MRYTCPKANSVMFEQVAGAYAAAQTRHYPVPVQSERMVAAGRLAARLARPGLWV